MKFVTWNVNGLRACITKGFNDYFNAYITYVLAISLPKNLVYLLPQSILLFVALKALSRPLASAGLIDTKIKDHITIF